MYWSIKYCKLIGALIVIIIIHIHVNCTVTLLSHVDTTSIHLQANIMKLIIDDVMISIFTVYVNTLSAFMIELVCCAKPL